MIVHAVRRQQRLRYPVQPLLYQLKLPHVADSCRMMCKEGLQHINAVQPYLVPRRLSPAVPVIMPKLRRHIVQAGRVPVAVDIALVRQVPVKLRRDLPVGVPAPGESLK